MRYITRAIMLLMLTACILSAAVYESLSPFTSKAINLKANEIPEANYEFQCKKTGDNIIMLTLPSPPVPLKDKVKITVHQTQSVEDDPAGVAIWELDQVTEEKGEYVFKATGEAEIVPCFVKIALIPAVETVDFNLQMFNELDPRPLVKEEVVTVDKFYSLNKAVFDMSIDKKNYYLDYIVTSSSTLDIKLFKKDGMVSIPIEITQGSDDYSFKSKGEPLVEKSEYILEITLTSDTPASFEVTFTEERYKIAALPSDFGQTTLSFEGTNSKFIYVLQDDITTNKDMYYTFNVVKDDVISIASFFTEVQDTTNTEIYAAIDKATFIPEEIISLSAEQRNVYFRFPNALDVSKKTIKVFLVTFNSKEQKGDLALSLTSPVSWKLDSAKEYNTNSIVVKQGKSALVHLEVASFDSAKTYLLGSSIPQIRIFEGPIVTKNNELQAMKPFNPVHLLDKVTKDITIELYNGSTEPQTINLQIEVIAKADSIEINGFSTNLQKVVEFNREGKDDEWFKIDYFETIEDKSKPLWWMFDKFIGLMTVHYKTTLDINLDNPVSLLSMSNAVEVINLQQIKSNLSIVRVTVKQNDYASLTMQLSTEKNAVTLNDFEQISFLPTKGENTISINDDFWNKQKDKETNLQISIIGHETKQDETQIIKVKVDETIHEISNYGILHIPKLTTNKITIDTSIYVTILVAYAQPKYYFELSNIDTEKSVVEYDITQQKVIFKLADPKVSSYKFAFNKKIEKTLYYGMNTGFEGYLPKPTVKKEGGFNSNTDIPYMNPFYIHADELKANEFYYVAFEFEEELADKELILTITKQKGDVGDQLIKSSDIIHMTSSDYLNKKFELDYESDMKKDNLVVFISFKTMPLAGSKIYFDVPLKDDIVNFDLDDKPNFTTALRIQKAYSIRLDIKGNLPLTLSYAYMTTEEYNKFNDKFPTTVPEFQSNGKDKITWTKLEVLLTNYYIFIQKKTSTNADEDFLFETEEQMYQNRKKGITIDSTATEYVIPRKYENGEYKINILAIKEEGIMYYVGFKQASITILREVYVKLPSFTSQALNLKENEEREKNYQFDCKRSQDNIIMLAHLQDDISLKDDVEITIHQDKSVEEDSQAAPVWEFSKVTQEIKDYPFKVTGDSDIIQCFVKITLLPTAKYSVFSLQMFTELDPRPMVRDIPLSVNKVYSLKKAVFSMGIDTLYHYLEYTITSKSMLDIRLFTKEDSLPISIQITHEGDDYTFKSKGEPLVKNYEYNLDITVYTPSETKATEPLFVVTFSEEKYGIEKVPSNTHDAKMQFYGTNSKFLYILQDEVTTDNDVFFTFDLNEGDDISISSFFTELPDTTDKTIYDAINKATFLPEEIVHISPDQRNVYFRFPNPMPDITKKTMKVFLMTSTIKTPESDFKLSVATTKEWKIDDTKIFNTKDIELKEHKSMLFTIPKESFKKDKTYLIGSSVEHLRIFKGPIVQKDNKLQELIPYRQLQLLKDITEDVTIEVINQSRKSQTIYLQVEIIENPDMIEYNYFKGNPEQIIEFEKKGKNDEWFMIDFIEKDKEWESKPRWWMFNRFTGKFTVEYQTTIKIKYDNPISLLSMTDAVEVRDLQQITSSLSIVRVSIKDTEYGIMNMEFNYHHEQIRLDDYKQINFIASPDRKTNLEIPKEIWDEAKEGDINLEIRIIGYKRTAVSNNDHKKIVNINYGGENHELSNYGFVHIEKLKKKNIVIETPIDVSLAINLAKPNYYIELEDKESESKQEYDIISKRVVYKFKNVKIASYKLSFNQNLSNFYHGMNKGFENYLPKPINLKKKDYDADTVSSYENPHYVNAKDLKENEFFYVAFEFKDLIPNLKLTINKEYAVFGDKLFKKNEIVHMTSDDYLNKIFELEYENDMKLNNLVLYLSFNEIVPEGSVIYFNSPLITDKEGFKIRESYKHIYAMERFPMIYSMRLDIKGNLPFTISLGYLTQQQYDLIPDQLPKDKPEFTFDDIDTITWKKTAMPYTNYLVFIEKTSDPIQFETEDQMYENRAKATATIDSKATEYIIPNDKIENGEYKVNILAVNEQGLMYYIGFKQTTIQIKNKDYKKLLPFTSQQVNLEAGTLPVEKYQFKCKKTGDNIIKHKSIKDKVSITIHKGKTVEEDSQAAPVWDLSKVTQETDDYAFKVTGDSEIVLCFVKIELLQTEQSASFTFEMFNELDPRPMGKGIEVSVDKLYSLNKAVFGMSIDTKYYYLDYTVTSKSTLDIKLFRKDGMIPIPIEITKNDDITFKSKGDPLIDNYQYILEITMISPPPATKTTVPLFKITFAETRIAIAGFEIDFDDAEVVFEGTNSKFLYSLQKEKNTNRDMYFTFNVANKEDKISISSFVTEVKDMSDDTIFEEIKKATFVLEKVVELSDQQRNVYFRFPNELDTTKKVMKIFLMTFKPKEPETPLLLSLTTPTSWKIDTSKTFNLLSININKGKSALVHLELNKSTNLKVVSYLIGSTSNSIKYYKGPIVQKDNKIQDFDFIHELDLIKDITDDITIEFCNLSEKAETIKIKLEVFQKPETIEWNHFLNYPQQTLEFKQNDEDQEWYIIDYLNTDKEGQWWNFNRLYGEVTVQYKTVIDLENEKSLIDMSDKATVTTVKELQKIKSHISIVKISVTEDHYISMTMNLQTPPKEVTLKKYEEVIFIASPSTPTKVIIPKKADDTTKENLEVRILGYEKEEDESSPVKLVFSNNQYSQDILNYNILPIETILSDTFTITSAITVSIKVSYTLPTYYEEIVEAKDSIRVIYQIKNKKIMSKLTDPRVRIYEFSFNKNIDTLLFSINRGYEQYIPKPYDQLKSTYEANEVIYFANPYFLNAMDLISDEFFYFSFELPSQMDMNDLLFTVKKKNYDFGDRQFGLKKSSKLERKDYEDVTFELEYEHKASLNYIVYYISFNDIPPAGSKIYFDSPISKDTKGFELNGKKNLFGFQRFLMVYSLRFDILGNVPLTASISYMSQEEYDKIPAIDKFPTTPPEFKTDGKDKLQWTAPEMAVSYYYVFIQKNAQTNSEFYETEDEMFEHRDKAADKLEKTVTEYTVPKDKYPNGNYKINILAANDELNYYVGFKQKDVQIDHSDSPKPASLTWLWILLGILAVGVIVGVIIIILRKSSDNGPTQQQFDQLITTNELGINAA